MKLLRLASREPWRPEYSFRSLTVLAGSDVRLEVGDGRVLADAVVEVQDVAAAAATY
jgi:hypothetical protein